MSRDLRHRRPVQLDLFHARPTRPRWTTLPTEVKQSVFPLLVRFLREQREHVASPARKETADD